MGSKGTGARPCPRGPNARAADGAENPGRLRHSQDASPHTTTRQKDRTRQPARSRTTRSQSPTRPLPEPASLGLALRLWSVSRPGLPHRHGRLPARMNETEATPSGTDPHLLTNGGESRRVGAARARTRQPRARARAKNRGVAPVHIPKAWMGTAAAPTGSQPQGSRRKEESRRVTGKAFGGAHTLRCRCAPLVRARNVPVHAQNPPPRGGIDTGGILGNLSSSELALSWRLHASLELKAGGR